jgi:hypothetical protein
MKRGRLLQGFTLALLIVVLIFLTLTLAQFGVEPAKQCAVSLSKAQFPKWVGCMIAAHEGLAGGLIGAGGALFAGWLAWSAVREQIDLQKAGYEPDVVAYLIPDRRYIHILNLVVANVGGGIARNVNIELDANPAAFYSKKIHLPAKKQRPILAVMPPSEQFHQLFASAIDMLQAPALDDFDMIVRFQNVSGKSYSNVCRATVVDFEGTQRIGSPPDVEAADALKAIADEVKLWGSGFRRLKIETITSKEEAERVTALHDAHMKKRSKK